MRKTFFDHMTSLSLAVVLGLSVVGSSAQAQGRQDIVDTAVGAGKFNTLVAAVKAAGLVQTLKMRGPFTVFAPTDAAFEKIPADTLQSLLRPENKDQLTAILTYHVVPGRVLAKDAFGLSNAPTVNGQRLSINRQDGKLQIDQSRLVATDIQCTNGVIHVIDTVLMPQTDRIPAVAQQAGQFKTLLAAVEAAGLAETLNGKGPFTVFAPTDAAFEKLPAGTVETLLQPENRDKLTRILKYHVLSGRVYSDQAAQAGSAKTLAGINVQTAVTAGGLRVNDSQVIKADIETANGVVHVIDAVLLPPAMGPRQAMTRLENAVNEGVPMFNHGNVHGCLRVYTSACQDIVNSKSDQMPQEIMKVLKTTLDHAELVRDERQRAWVLRAGIDTAYHGMARMERISSQSDR